MTSSSTCSLLCTGRTTWRSSCPSIWQPNGVYQLTEIVNNLRGVIPQSTTLNINPEDWFFVKS